MAMRIALCHADVRTPAQESDKLFIRLELERLDRSGFTVNSQACLEERLVACGCLRLVAIEANTRRRDALLDGVDRWREPMNGHVKPRRNPGKSLKRLHKVSTTNDTPSIHPSAPTRTACQSNTPANEFRTKLSTKAGDLDVST